MKNSKEINRKALVLTFIWPILGLIFAIKNYKNFKANKIIILFCALFGFTFVIEEELDGAFYAERLKMAYNQPFSVFIENFSGLYNTTLDFVQPLITFLVSRVTDSHHILFTVYALIFAWFWVKSMQILSSNFDLRNNNLSNLYMVLFISIIPISHVNGFRMWTAAWIFIFGALHVILNQDKRFVLICLAACTVHFSLFSANAILFLWMILGNRKWVYLIIALITLTISEIDLSIIRGFAEGYGAALENKVNAYTGTAYASRVEEQKENYVWFLKLSPILNKYLLLLNTIIFFAISLKRKLPKIELNLLSFTLLFFSYANVISLVPSGRRFLLISFVFSTVLSIVLYSKYFKKRLDSLFGLLSLATILLTFMIAFRVAASNINTVLFGPSIFIPFGYDLDWSLKDWLF